MILSTCCRCAVVLLIYTDVYPLNVYSVFFFFFSSRRRHTRFDCDWSSDVCSSDLFQEVDEARVTLDHGGGKINDLVQYVVKWGLRGHSTGDAMQKLHVSGVPRYRSEERRVGKECRSRWSPYH